MPGSASSSGGSGGRRVLRGLTGIGLDDIGQGLVDALQRLRRNLDAGGLHVGLHLLGAVQQLKPVADELGLTIAQLAIAWVLQNDNVAAAIVGASRPEQVRASVKAAGVQIPAEALQRVDEALADVIQSDPAQTAQNAPATRPT